MAEEYTIVAGPLRPHVRLDDQPVLDESAVLGFLRGVPQVEELTEEGGELVFDTLVFQFELLAGSDGRLRWVTGDMHYDHVLSESDLRAAFGILTGLAESVGARLFEASEDCPEMTPAYVEETIRQNLGLPVETRAEAADAHPRIRP